MSARLVAVAVSSLMTVGAVWGKEVGVSADEAPIVVTRAATQGARQGPAENFTGSARIDQAFQATAAPTTAMSHIAIVEQLDGRNTDWMEKVTDEQYGRPVRAASAPTASAAPSTAAGQPTPAQRLIGDFSPKMVQLTDDVLFGDVWARLQLSPRDRSLITVSALIAMNRPDQLRSHLQRARDNGVTQEEIVESITHLAFYAGWPSAMTAIAVAKEVFESK
jgi:4-carboxymuconolactone decarboxylase